MAALVSTKERRAEFTGDWSEDSVRRLERAGAFPRRVKVGPRRVFWLRSELERWLEEQSTGAEWMPEDRSPAQIEADRIRIRPGRRW
jgi:prophage regulatory protein